MTALTDVRRVAQSLTVDNEIDDRALLLAYYGAQEPHFMAASQAEIADELRVSRQAVHARIRRLQRWLAQIKSGGLSLDPATIQALTMGEDVGRRALGGLRHENAVRFYQDLTGTRPARPAYDATLGRVPAFQFDALTLAAYGSRRQSRTSGSRLVLVNGMSVKKAALQSGLPETLLNRDVLEALALHEDAKRAYGA